MRQAAVIGITLATILVFGQVLMFNVGVRTDYAHAAALSDGAYAPALQTTATATAASPAASPGALPETGAESNASLILLGAVALIVLGVSAVMLVSTRRRSQT
ncbi:MAG TPA: LPXTG cell wall anchor domain-containing protein [Herpetosiphonaceae bacterium]